MTTTLIPGANLGDTPVLIAFPLGSYDGKPQRHIDFSWTCGENDAGHEVRVQLSCFHTRGRYVATVNNVVCEGNGVSITAPFDAARVAVEPCSRYSKGAFEKFADQALETLRVLANEPSGAVNVEAYLRGEHAVSR